jgi:two-component system chemotaxis response regulator CheY
MSVPGDNTSAEKKRTILVVDDSAYVRRMIRFALAQDTFELIDAHDGMEAVKQLENNSVDLVITDLKMPNMDGFELIREIRQRPESALIPIIMLTGETDEQCRERAREAGVSAFIVKPFVPEQISGLIRAIFE